MVGFLENFADFGNSLKHAAFSVLRPAGRHKRRFDDSAEERSDIAGDPSPLKRQATDREQQQSGAQEPQLNGVAHQHRQQSRTDGLLPARLPFSPGFLTEQRRGSKNFSPRPQQRPAAQHTDSAEPRSLLPSPSSRQPAAKWRQPGIQPSPPNRALAALQFATPASRQNGAAGVATGLGRALRTNGSVSAEQAANIRRSTLTRGCRVLGPGATNRSLLPQHRLATTPLAGSGSMAQPAEQWQPSDAQLTAQASSLIAAFVTHTHTFTEYHAIVWLQNSSILAAAGPADPRGKAASSGGHVGQQPGRNAAAVATGARSSRVFLPVLFGKRYAWVFL